MKREFTRKLVRFSSTTLLSFVGLLWSFNVTAHEFWLQPEIYQPAVGDTVAVHALIGADFIGDSLPYIPELVKRFTVVGRNGERPAGAGFAADPAGRVEINQPGLHVIAYENIGTDTETDWPVFEKYLNEEGLEKHLPEARKLADSYADIATEYYRRHAVALLQVGAAAPAMPPIRGLGFVIQPLVNPYALTLGQKLPVQVRRHGQPVAGVQVHVLNRSAGGSVARVRTDETGTTQITVDRAGVWMLNAVTMTRDASRKYHWQSVWTSLTFRLN